MPTMDAIDGAVHGRGMAARWLWSTMLSALAIAAFVCRPVLVLCHMILVYVFLYDLCPSCYRILVFTLGIRCLYPRVFF